MLVMRRSRPMAEPQLERQEEQDGDGDADQQHQ